MKLRDQMLGQGRDHRTSQQDFSLPSGDGVTIGGYDIVLSGIPPGTLGRIVSIVQGFWPEMVLEDLDRDPEDPNVFWVPDLEHVTNLMLSRDPEAARFAEPPDSSNLLITCSPGNVTLTCLDPRAPEIVPILRAIQALVQKA